MSEQQYGDEFPRPGYRGPAVELFTVSRYEVVIIGWPYARLATIQRKDGKEIPDTGASRASPYLVDGRPTYLFDRMLLRLPVGPVDYSMVDEGGVV